MCDFPIAMKNKYKDMKTRRTGTFYFHISISYGF